MRRKRLPPLHSLQGFDAAARYLSFTRAAAELNLTQGAVSRQVRELETHLGVSLFTRMTRRIVLTTEGLEYHRFVSDMLDQLEAASRFSVARPKVTLTVSAPPTFSSLWLMPRLHAWASAHQDVDIRVIVSSDPVDFTTSEDDLAIRVGRLPGRAYALNQPRIDKVLAKRWDDLRVDELCADVLVPVCSSRLIENPVADASDLDRFPLIHVATRSSAWPDWFQAHDCKWRKRRSEDLRFGHFFMGLDTARQGRGIALVPDLFLTSTQVSADFIIPFDSRIRSAGEYYLLTRASKLQESYIADFRSWLLEQAVDRSNDSV